jgi:hypothetical protein
MKLIAEDLLASVKRRSFAPTSQSTFTDQDFYDIIGENLSCEIVPQIMSARENFFLTYKRVPLVAGVSRYVIPERAAGTALKDLWHVDASGNRLETPFRNDVHDLEGGEIGTGTPREFLLYGDEILVSPVPAASEGYVEFWYYRRPSKIVATSSCAKITAVSTVAGLTTFTVDTDLTASLSVGSLLDFISAKSPFLSWADDVAITAITATTIEVSAADVENEASTVEPVVGDYICLAGQSNLPQIPQELHPVLAQSSALQVLEALNHQDKIAVAAQKLDRMWKNGFKLISNRVESEPEQVYNRSGIMNFI